MMANSMRISELEAQLKDMRLKNAHLHTKVYRLEEHIALMEQRLTNLSQRLFQCRKERTEEVQKLKAVIEAYEGNMVMEESEAEGGDGRIGEEMGESEAVKLKEEDVSMEGNEGRD